MVQVYHFPQTMPRFLSLHKHYCALSRAWRACLYPRSGKVGSSQSLQSSLWLLLVSQWSLGTEGRGIIHFTTKSTDLQHVRFNCSHDYLNIHLEIQISRVFFGKKWLKESVWGKKIHRFAFGRKPEQPNLNNLVLRRPVNFYVLVVPFKTIPVSRL